MKRAIFVGLLSVLSYVLYIFVIVFPLSKLLIPTESKLIGIIIVIPVFHLAFILPFIIIFSLVLNRKFTSISIVKNTFLHFFFYLILTYSYRYIFDGGINFKAWTFDLEAFCIFFGLFCYFLYHVAAIKYILTRKRAENFLSPSIR